MTTRELRDFVCSFFFPIKKTHKGEERGCQREKRLLDERGERDRRDQRDRGTKVRARTIVDSVFSVVSVVSLVPYVSYVSYVSKKESISKRRD